MEELEIIYQMQSVSVFLDIAKIADFWWKNANLSGTQVVCHVIDVSFGSFLDKV